MSWNQKAFELAEEIKNTREFMELKYAQVEISKNPGLKKQVEEFKQKQQDIFSAAKAGKQSELKVAEIQETFKSLSKIPQVDRYLAAGKNFNNLMVKVFESINNPIEKEFRIK